MKRQLLAAGLAMGVHGLLLGLLLATGGDWLQRAAPEPAFGQAVTVTLEAGLKSRGQAKPRRQSESEPAVKRSEPRVRDIAPNHPAPVSVKKGGRKRETTRPVCKRVKPRPSKPAPLLPAARQTSEPTAATRKKPAEKTTGRPLKAPGEGEGAPRQGAAAAVSAASGQRDTSLARPLYRLNPLPRYPVMARRRHDEGTVLLSVLVDAQGRVEDLRVAASSGSILLDRAALEAVREWRFEPGRRGGRPLAMRVEVPVRFVLR